MTSSGKAQAGNPPPSSLSSLTPFFLHFRPEGLHLNDLPLREGGERPLHVYHILEPGLRAEIPAPLYEEKLELVSMVADLPGIGRALEKFRDAPSGD